MGLPGTSWYATPGALRPAPWRTQAYALRIDRNDSQLEVGRDPRAPAVAAAPYGVLRIAGGAIRTELHLDPTQLGAASVAYSPLSNEVTFELQLAGGGVAGSETFRLQDGPRHPAAVVRAAAGTPKVLGHRRPQFSDGGL